MLAVFQLIETIAPTSSTVLITGESGTGKELVARAIHVNSLAQATGRSWRSTAARCPRRCSTRSCSATCAARSPAPTRNKKGLIEVAEKGTIFLDEIGEMSPMVQVKLLRVLQERKFRRLGGTEEVEADIRIIAATNRDLSKMVADGDVPRGPLLPDQRHPGAAAAAARAARRHPAAGRALRREVRGADGEGRSRASRAPRWPACGSYPWPGNVRELENAMERAVALERTPADPAREPARTGPGRLGRHRGRGPPRRPPKTFPTGGFDLEQHVQHIEREYIAEALRRADGVKVKAAELLGMSFRRSGICSRSTTSSNAVARDLRTASCELGARRVT